MSKEDGFGRVHGLGRVSIVGAGQVGTMLGMALVEAGSDAGVTDVSAFDRTPSVATASLERGAVHRILERAEEALEADTLVLAMPVPSILSFLEEFGSRLRPGSFLIDTASAKVAVTDAMRRTVPQAVHPLGGHPMAGTEVAGPAGARPELCRGAPFALVPVRDDPEALSRGRELARAIGALPVEVDAETHDRTVARTSHLPHLVAYALAGVAGEAFLTGDALPVLVSTGFGAATRLAASDPDMVAGFLWANAREVRRSVAEITEVLHRLSAAIEDGPDHLSAALSETRAPALDPV
jgi:prephenate dehydrogenase